MIDYEVGQIPSKNLGIILRDDNDNPLNIVGYDDFKLEIIGNDDEELDLTGVEVLEVPDLLGSVVVQWPKNRSVFDRKGKYLMRLVLTKSDGTVDYTRPEQILVRDFGRLNN